MGEKTFRIVGEQHGIPQFKQEAPDGTLIEDLQAEYDKAAKAEFLENNWECAKCEQWFPNEAKTDDYLCDDCRYG